MANAIKWEAAFSDQGAVLTTELDALANAGRSAAGSAFDNGSGLHQYGLLELPVDFVSAPSAGAYCDIYMVKAPDGTNYEDATTAARVASLPILATTSAQRVTSRMFPLPPCKVKFLLENRTGQAFPASGTELNLYTANDEIQ